MRVNIRIPKTWNDLSDRQLQELALALEHYRSIPDDKKKSGRALKKLYIRLIKNVIRENAWWKVYIALRQIPPSEYVQHIEFLLKGNQRTLFPPKIKVNRTYCLPPGPRMQTLEMGEFSFADSVFYRFRTQGNDTYLNLLCASLYRPKNARFEKIAVEKNQKHWQKIPRKKKLAILYAYEGSRNYITKLYPKIFPKQESKSGNTKYTPFGRLIHHKVNFDPSKMEIVEQLNIHKFLSIYQNELTELQNRKTYGRG